MSFKYFPGLLILVLVISGCFLVGKNEVQDVSYDGNSTPEVVFTVVPELVMNDIEIPTVVPVPTATQVPITKPTKVPIFQTDSEIKVEDKTLQEEVFNSIVGVNSFKYSLEGVARVDAGGIFVGVPISGLGSVTSTKAVSIFEANLLGIGLYVESAKLGNNIYTRESPAEKWRDSENLGIGHISNDFWAAIGESFLRTDLGESNILTTEEKIIFLFDDSGSIGSVTPLFELIATQEEALRFSPETWEVQLEVDLDDYQISKVTSAFSLNNGGLFLSEVFGMEGLSGVGRTDVEVLVNFSDIGEDIQVEIPQLD